MKSIRTALRGGGSGGSVGTGIYGRALRFVVGSLLALFLLPVQADSVMRGRVIEVMGGDALTLLDDRHRVHKIRLAHVDAPELGQPFGDEAQTALAAMVLNRTVEAQTRGQDDQGWHRAEVIATKGRLVNLELVKRGLAWHDDLEEQTASERDRYRGASTDAQRQRRGMWALDRLELPRDYRARVESAQTWWMRITYAGVILMLVIIALGIWGDRIEAWVKKLDELEKARAEEYRLARAAAEAEEAERQRVRDLANREMDRLAEIRRRDR